MTYGHGHIQSPLIQTCTHGHGHIVTINTALYTRTRSPLIQTCHNIRSRSQAVITGQIGSCSEDRGFLLQAWVFPLRPRALTDSQTDTPPSAGQQLLPYLQTGDGILCSQNRHFFRSKSASQWQHAQTPAKHGGTAFQIF